MANGGMPAIADEAPSSEEITPYDLAHITIYLRLIDADDEGAPVADMAPIRLGLNPAKQPDRASRVVESRLRRARWMTSTGYRQLLKPPQRKLSDDTVS